MIKNLLKIALRNIWKNKILAVINVLGLAIGLSATIVIAAIILYEVSFDDFHEDGKRIYRIITKTNTNDGEFHNKGVPIPLGKTLKEVLSGIEKAAMFFVINQNKVENKKGNLVFQNPDKIIYADKTYFELFHYKWLAGNSSETLSNPNEVVLTAKRANKYFPNMSPEEIMGKILIYNDTVPITVVGIILDFEGPTDFYFQEFISKKSAAHLGQKELIDNDDWFGSSSSTQLFIKRGKKRSIEAIEHSLANFSKNHGNPEAIAIGQKNSFLLQPLDDLHFNSAYGIFDNSEYQGNRSLLIGLTVVAIFLLLLGCINFINLNTAQGIKRSKEIGIRKTLGSSRKQLVFQFLGEALFLTIVATVLSLLLSSWLLWVFSDLIPGRMHHSIFGSFQFAFFVILLVAIVTLLSGFYPALVLSSYKPTSVLKSGFKIGKNKATFRKSLTVFQFVIAQLFIITTILIGKQVSFLTNKDIGFKTKSVVSIKISQIQDTNKRLTFVNNLKSIPEVYSVSLGDGTPFQAMMAHPIQYIKNDIDVLNYVIILHGDIEYRRLYGIELLAGRERLNDTIDEFLINETYSKAIGFSNPEKAIGNSLYLKRENKTVPIVGVMKDFNNAPLHYRVEPLALTGNNYNNFGTLHFGLQGSSGDWPNAILKIEKKWGQLFPNLEFDIKFVDETVKRFYEQERRTLFLMKWASILAILISCIGLLGLVIYTTERRTKEIGIRKVLGASVYQLNILLCKEFLVLVGVSFAMATPLAYLTSANWLNRFTYKSDMSCWVFLLGGLILASVALIIVSFRTISSAKSNPIDSLRMD